MAHRQLCKAAARAAQPSWTEIRVELIPRIPHRREAVTEMACLGSDDRLGRAVAGADDQVVAIKIEPLNRRWEREQVVTIRPPHGRQPLDDGRVDGMLLDDGG